MPPRFLEYCRDRLFEWVMTAAMLGLAVEILIWPSTIGASAFHLILRIVGAEHMGMFFLIFGTMRVLALFANGRLPVHGPRLRALGAAAASLMWGQMCAALLVIIPFKDGIPPPGIPIFFALTVGELISAYRAISDARFAG